MTRVSEILKSVGIVDYSGVPQEILDRAAQFGTAVHKACELDDLGTLDENTVHEAVVPYLNAWKVFKEEKLVLVPFYKIEQRIECEKFGFCGTPDRISFIENTPCVIDIKSTASIMPSTAIQLAAYALLYRAGNIHLAKSMRRFVVQLKPDATFAVQEYKNNRSDIDTFMHALSVHNWKMNHKSGGSNANNKY